MESTYFTRKPDAECVSAAIISMSGFEEVLRRGGFGLSMCHCGVLVPRPGIEPVPPAFAAWYLNHWIVREIPGGSQF